MKNFLARKWHRLPIGIVAALAILALTVGSVLAAYNFLSFTTVITVDEPLTIEYNLYGAYGGDSEWHPLGDDDSLTLERSAGDRFAMSLRIYNAADNALTVDTVTTCPNMDNLTHFVFTGFPSASVVGNCPNGYTWFPVTVDVKGDAPPGNYNVTFTFTRE